MSDNRDPLSFRSIIAGLLVGLVVTVAGGVAVHVLTQGETPTSFSTEASKQGLSEDLEAIFNTDMARYDARYAVLTDEFSGFSQLQLTEFVIPGRRKFLYYPYLVLGDFDGDKLSDIAAVVRNRINGHERLAVKWGSGRRFTFYDELPCSALSFLPANEWRSAFEQLELTLVTDAIEVQCYDVSSRILYWDGSKFQTYFVAD